MKTIDSRKANSQAKQGPASLAARAAEAEKQADVARKLARLAKAKFKDARKAYKQAKKFAKQARKEAKAAAKALRQRARAARLSRKRRAPARPVSPPVARQVAAATAQARPLKRSRQIVPGSTAADQSAAPVSNVGPGIAQA